MQDKNVKVLRSNKKVICFIITHLNNLFMLTQNQQKETS